MINEDYSRLVIYTEAVAGNLVLLPLFTNMMLDPEPPVPPAEGELRAAIQYCHKVVDGSENNLDLALAVLEMWENPDPSYERSCGYLLGCAIVNRQQEQARLEHRNPTEEERNIRRLILEILEIKDR
jgi:hypothetical protein